MSDPKISVTLEYEQAVMLWDAMTYMSGERRAACPAEYRSVAQAFKERLYDAIELAERGAEVP
jgi:hypothetical protein